jgi:hypothetical protein
MSGECVVENDSKNIVESILEPEQSQGAVSGRLPGSPGDDAGVQGAAKDER